MTESSDTSGHAAAETAFTELVNRIVRPPLAEIKQHVDDAARRTQDGLADVEGRVDDLKETVTGLHSENGRLAHRLSEAQDASETQVSTATQEIHGRLDSIRAEWLASVASLAEAQAALRAEILVASGSATSVVQNDLTTQTTWLSGRLSELDRQQQDAVASIAALRDMVGQFYSGASENAAAAQLERRQFHEDVSKWSAASRRALITLGTITVVLLIADVALAVLLLVNHS